MTPHLALLAAALLAQPQSDDTKPKVVFPHPLITEILAAVPKDSGDANLDGSRDATGDEFVELMNPHERPINLKGYTLSDRNAGGQGAVVFTFPDFTLEPGETLVLFNGFGAKIPTAGNENTAPTEKHPKLGAWVFTMNNQSEYASFANKGDWVLLTSPSGAPVHVISWGEFDESLPTDNELVAETAEPGGQGSLCRYLLGGPMVGHTALDGRLFSPGKHPIQAIHAQNPEDR